MSVPIVSFPAVFVVRLSLAQALADALGEASADAEALDDGAAEPAAEALGDGTPPVEQAVRTRVARRTIDDLSALRIRVLLEFLASARGV